MYKHRLSEFIAEVILTSHYLAEPLSHTEAEMTDAEVRCLKVVNTFAPIGMQDIAKRIYATKPRATQLVALLESRALVDRSVAADRRRIVVTPTKAGKQAISKLNKRYEALAAAIEAKLGPKDTETLCQLLQAITPLSELEPAQQAKNAK